MAKHLETHVIKFLGHSEGFHITSAVSPSWNNGGRVYNQLLQSLAIVPQYDFEKYVVRNERSLELATELHTKLLKLESDNKDCYILDITECRLGINTVDAIVPDLIQLATGPAQVTIVLVAADFVVPLAGSPCVEDLSRELKEHSRVLFFVDQLGRTFTAGQSSEYSLEDEVAPINDFAAPPTESEFRWNIIRKSQRWFGHFEVSSDVHVRTHYDCYHDVLMDNWLFRYVQTKASKAIEHLQPDTLVGFGLADASVLHFASQLGSQLKIPYVMHTPLSTGHLGKLREHSRVLLVSDILLTGSTAQARIKEIQSVGADVVGVLVLLTLSNSKETVADGLPVMSICGLRRPYYNAGDDCPLCRCNVEPKQVKSLLDFRQLPDQVIAYDFWEAVYETRAFDSRHMLNDDRHFTYYIDTEKICGLYAQPIARQLLHQLRHALRYTQPQAVIYPEGTAARLLAEEVARQLVCKKPIEVSRDFLKLLRLRTRVDIPPEFQTIRDKQVLVVDDGCNTLETVSAMEDLLRRSHAAFAGYVVLLNRLIPEVSSKKFDRHDSKYQYYYHWPVQVHARADACPECWADQVIGGAGQ